ncbi:hypothetical protein [Cystobacter fuscus]|uniref:DUF7738 domain-containing protein n=1 Tax=Cystobacter fuscus TaxID=43 RepID=UPI002B29B07E|nr:hypothetical protein F0U63_40115 [Cystobacter fuscus]
MTASRWAGLGVLLLLGGCREPVSTPSAPVPPPAAAQPLLTVEGVTVRYKGQLLPWEGPTERWKQVLGPPSREELGILTWDELGLFVYDQDARVPGPESLSVLFGRTMHSPLTEGAPDFWPRKSFSGRLLVDGAAISSGSTLDEINRDKKGASFARDYMSGVYSYYVEDFYVRLDYGHDRTLTSFGLSKALPDSTPPSP